MPVWIRAGLLAPPASPRRTSGQPSPDQRRISRPSVKPRRKGYLPKASSRVGAQTSLDVSTSTLVLLTARSVAPRPKHVLVQTALSPTLSQWVPSLGMIHPHVTLGPCTPLGVQSLQLSTWTAKANRLGMLPVPNVRAHCSGPLGPRASLFVLSSVPTRA